MRKYKKYSDSDLIFFAKEVETLAGLLKKVGLKPAGGNYINIKRKLQELGVDTSHWKGQAWSKDQRLKDYKQYTRVVNLKKHLLLLRGHMCEECGNHEWLGQPIPIEVDHVDGDRTNNALGNLKLLCPNCHALTPTWRNRKR